MATITLSITTADGTFAVNCSPDDSVVQEMLAAVRTVNNISASDPLSVLTFQANIWMDEINKLVTQQRVANVVPLKLTMA